MLNQTSEHAFTVLPNNSARSAATPQLQFQFSAPQLEVEIETIVGAGVAPVPSQAAMHVALPSSPES
jgi:hypothetical protein